MASSTPETGELLNSNQGEAVHDLCGGNNAYFNPNFLDPNGTDCASGALIAYNDALKKCCDHDYICIWNALALASQYYDSCLQHERINNARGHEQRPVNPGPGQGGQGGQGPVAPGNPPVPGGGGKGSGSSCMVILGVQICSNDGLDVDRLKNTNIDDLVNNQLGGGMAAYIAIPGIVGGAGLIDAAGPGIYSQFSIAQQQAASLYAQGYVLAVDGVTTLSNSPIAAFGAGIGLGFLPGAGQAGTGNYFGPNARPYFSLGGNIDKIGGN